VRNGAESGTHGPLDLIEQIVQEATSGPVIVRFLHVPGGMILVGGLTASAGPVGFARGDARLLRFGYWSLLAVSVPGWILLRIGTEWIYSRER
jgi:hypothetical protein